MKASHFFTMAALSVAVIITPACSGGGGGGSSSSSDSDSYEEDDSSSTQSGYAPTSLSGRTMKAVSTDKSDTWLYTFDSEYTYSNTLNGAAGSGYIGAYTYKRISDTEAEIEIHGNLRAGSGTEKGTIYLTFISKKSAMGRLDRTLNGYINMASVPMTFTFSN